MTKLTDIELSPGGGFKGIGPLGLEGKDPSQAGGIFDSVISTIIGLMTIIAFVWFTILFITGGLGIMTAGGDKQKLEDGRRKIVMGIVGVVVVIAGVFIIDLIGNLLGIPDILNPGELIERISP